MATTIAQGKAIVSAVIDEEQRAELIRLARAGDRSVSAEIRRAVAEHLQRAAPEPRETS